MANILEYMKTTSPEAAKEANSKTTRNMIRQEVREHFQFLGRVKETAKQIAYEDTVKEIESDLLFMCKWMIKFGLNNEL